MAVKSRREEYAAITRAALLDAAGDLFAKNGFDATSVDDIAKAARVSKGAVYHHFPDKSAIFDEAFRITQQEVVAQAAAAIPPDLQGEEHLWQVTVAAVQGFIDAYVTDDRKRRLLRQSAGVLGVHRCRQIDADLALPLVAGILEELQGSGQLRDNVSIQMAATVIFGTLCEAATSLALADDCEQAGREASQVVSYMLSGLVKVAA